MRRLAYGFFLIGILTSCSESSPGPEGVAGNPGVAGNTGTAANGGVGGSAGTANATAGSSPGLAGAGNATSGGAVGAGAAPSVGGTAAGGESISGGTAGTPASGAPGTSGASPTAGSGPAGTGGVDSGTAGASGAPGGAGAPSGATGCGGGTTIFCEDFEAQPMGAAQKTSSWEPVANTMGTLTIDGTHARGQKALHVHTQENGRAYISVSPFAPPNNSFFARMHIWVTAFPSAPNYAHYTLVEATGTPAGMIRPIGGQFIEGEGALWGVGADGGPTGDWTNWKTSAPSEAGKWVCIEFELAAADNNIRVWIDGTAKPEMSVSTKDHGGSGVDFVFPTFDKIWFGWWLYHSGPTPNQFDLWFDDIAIATTRLGC